MESEIRRTKNQIKRSDFPTDMPSLAMSCARQNDDLRKTLRRFEKEKRKQIKSLDDDICELQKFMQELQCVTAISADDILPSQEKPIDRRLHASRDTSKKSQNEKLTSTSPSTPDLYSTAPGVYNDRKVRHDQANNDKQLIGNSSEQKYFPRNQKRRRSSSVGEMCSGTLERLTVFAGYNQALRQRRMSLDAGRQPLLNRRRSLDSGRQTFSLRRRSLDVETPTSMKTSPDYNIGNTIEPLAKENTRRNVSHINEQPKLSPNKIDILSDNFNFESGKFNALRRAPSWRSMLCQRPPSTVLEEASSETSSHETENVTNLAKTCSKPNSASSSKTDTHNRKPGGGLLSRRTTGQLILRRSSLGTRPQLDDSYITDEKTMRTRRVRSYPTCEKDNLHWQETPGYKENTSSRLRKQNSRDSAIGLTPKILKTKVAQTGTMSASLKAADSSMKARDRMSPDISKAAVESFPKLPKSLVALISPKLPRKYFKDSGPTGSQKSDAKVMEAPFFL